MDVFVQTTFERELRPHSPLYVTFSYVSLDNCTTKDVYEYQVPQPSSAAGKRRNDKTHLSTPSECHIRRTLCENFRESCLDDFHDTVRKHGFIPSVVWPLLYVRSCWCFRVLQFLVTLTMSRKQNGVGWPLKTVRNSIELSFSAGKDEEDKKRLVKFFLDQLVSWDQPTMNSTQPGSLKSHRGSPVCSLNIVLSKTKKGIVNK